jgi:hypothetical protein
MLYFDDVAVCGHAVRLETMQLVNVIQLRTTLQLATVMARVHATHAD